MYSKFILLPETWFVFAYYFFQVERRIKMSYVRLIICLSRTRFFSGMIFLVYVTCVIQKMAVFTRNDILASLRKCHFSTHYIMCRRPTHVRHPEKTSQKTILKPNIYFSSFEEYKFCFTHRITIPVRNPFTDI